MLQHFLRGLALCVLMPGMISAQSAQVGFGGFTGDASQPVEVAADQLEVDQTDGSALFSGNVIVIQGEMKLSANTMRVEYANSADNAANGISKLFASGNVILVNGLEAAEADNAVYTIASGEIEMTGNVLLTQGQNVMSAEKLVADITNGTARLEGRVKTTLGGAPKK
ncbi:MAG: lipopolysaccharide transport periplasmic protein LptA [Pseudoruegeria sp.]